MIIGTDCEIFLFVDWAESKCRSPLSGRRTLSYSGCKTSVPFVIGQKPCSLSSDFSLSPQLSRQKKVPSPNKKHRAIHFAVSKTNKMPFKTKFFYEIFLFFYNV